MLQEDTPQRPAQSWAFPFEYPTFSDMIKIEFPINIQPARTKATPESKNVAEALAILKNSKNLNEAARALAQLDKTK